MGFSLILRAFFGFPNECQFIECQFWGKFRVFQVFLSVSDSAYLDISTFVEYNYSTNVE